MKPTLQELFEQAIEYPDTDLRDRLNSLVGLDDHINRLTKILSLLVRPDGIKVWAKKFHPKANKSLNAVLRRPPLVVLAGDVGSGKSELALTIGDAVARQENISVLLLPLSLSARGQGRVGEMTQLISAAFDYTIEEAKKFQSTGKGAVILLVDEADALAQSRENAQMHHEDRAGVNSFIRGIDRIANAKLPAAVIMCTNRLTALDPAIKRRSAEILKFERPNKMQRFSALENPLKELGFSNGEIDEAVSATGGSQDRPYGYTYSDLMQRLIPSMVLSSYPDKAVNPAEALKLIKSITPTPPFKDAEHD